MLFLVLRKEVIMKFRVKDMDIATGGILVAILNQKDAELLDLSPEDRIKLRHNSHETIAVLDISESERAVPRGQIGLFEEVLDRLRVERGDTIELGLTAKPESVNHIREKIHGKRLGYYELYSIVDDIVNDRLTSIEKTYFVSASYAVGLGMSEIAHLTRAIVRTGEQLHFKDPVFDKHSIGGIPANRTTMLIVPIVTAAGLLMPKTSSRAITSPAGTADTMEVLANVTLTAPHLKRVVKRTNGCIVWGGAMNLAPADDKIIEIERPLALDVEGQMLASVMAKKASVGATHVLIDIPCGKRAKCKTKEHAMHLSHMFETLGKKLGMKVKVIVTDGRQPIGRGVGPVLEARDVLWVLQNDEQAPADLRAKALRMAGMILEMGGVRKGYERAVELLEDGEAWKKMKQIIKAQGEQEKRSEVGEFHVDATAQRSGTVREIDNTAINKIARAAGAPTDKGAGLYLEKKVGEKVKMGETLFTVYAENEFKMGFAKETLKGLHVYRVQ